MTAVVDPATSVDAKRVCLFCKENGHDVTMQLCEGKNEGVHHFCPCCDRLDRKFRGQFHLVEEFDLEKALAAKQAEESDDDEDDDDWGDEDDDDGPEPPELVDA